MFLYRKLVGERKQPQITKRRCGLELRVGGMRGMKIWRQIWIPTGRSSGITVIINHFIFCLQQLKDV